MFQLMFWPMYRLDIGDITTAKIHVMRDTYRNKTVFYSVWFSVNFRVSRGEKSRIVTTGNFLVDK